MDTNYKFQFKTDGFNGSFILIKYCYHFYDKIYELDKLFRKYKMPIEDINLIAGIEAKFFPKESGEDKDYYFIIESDFNENIEDWDVPLRDLRKETEEDSYSFLLIPKGSNLRRINKVLLPFV